MGNLYEDYKKKIRPILAKDLMTGNLMAVPKIKKIVLNIGAKEAINDSKVLESAVGQLALISGQKPIVTRAKKAIAGFKLRKKDPVGIMVTLRGKKMHDFFEKLVSIVLPRVRDFHGVEKKSFDGHGNYSLGIKEQIVFPEIDYAKIDKIRGLEITICTTGKSNKEAEALLNAFGMPFQKQSL